MSGHITTYKEWRKIQESIVDAETAVKIAKNHGLKLKPYSANNPKPKKHLDKFPKGAPELVSAVSTYGSAKFDSDLIDIVDKIQDETKIKLNITGGDDWYHRKYKSRHSSGKAIDFVIDGPATNDRQTKIEKAVVNIMKSGEYPNLGMINEYKNPSGHATAGHFHLSTGKTTEYSYFYFVKDADGNRLTGKGSAFDNKIKEMGGETKVYQGKDLPEVTVTAKGKKEAVKLEPKPIEPIETEANDIPQMKTF